MGIKEHIFVCLNERPPDDPKGCCMSRGAGKLFDQLREETRGIRGVRINKAGCLGRCAEGPVIVRYPEGEWLVHATAADISVLTGKIIKTNHSREGGND